MDYTTLITSEHNQKPNFVAVVNLLANGVGAITQVAQSLYSGTFDLDQAEGVQLDILGLWIGQSRDIPNALPQTFFGFSDNPNAGTFGERTNPAIGAPFYDLGKPIGSDALLSDGTYRTVLKAKVQANQYQGDFAGLENAISLIAGVPFVIYDAGTLRPTITLLQPVSSLTQAILVNIDLLPRPAGVSYCILFELAAPTWTAVGTALAVQLSPGLYQVTKATGGNAWDSGIYDGTTYNPIAVGWQSVDATSAWAAGLAINPSSTINYVNLAYGFYTPGAGTLQVVEAGAIVATYGTFAANDSFVVNWDGANVIYLHNGKILRITPQAGGSLGPLVSLNTVGGSLTDITLFVN